jgi:signal transduction histidine kinase
VLSGRRLTGRLPAGAGGPFYRSHHPGRGGERQRTCAARVRLAALAPTAVPARVAAGLAGLIAASGALAIAAGPGRATTYAGISAAGAVLTAGAGVGLIAAGAVIGLGRRSRRRAGDLALLAGLTWYAPVWVAWQDGPTLIPSIAMVAAGFALPLIVHLAVAYPTGRVSSQPTRVLVGATYAEAAVAGCALALFRDPYSDPGCLANCNVNAFLVRSLPSLSRAVEISDRWFTATAALALSAVCAVRLTRASTAARTRLVPVFGPAMVFGAAVAARAAVLQAVTVEDPFNTALFTIFAISGSALVLLAAGHLSAVARARTERRAVARIAADLGEAPGPGSVAIRPRQALRDPSLQIAYWLPAENRYVDASGQAVPEPTAEPGRAVTSVTRNEHMLAAISHSDAATGIAEHIGPAITLGMENARLQAELLAQLTQLRASRVRIIQAGDSARRGLERDLHDGAQQHLLALSYDIRLARAAAQADGDGPVEQVLAAAVQETQTALEDLRELAHGIYPAILADAGIASALATVAETAPLPVDIQAVPDRRYPAQVETTVYFTVAELLDEAGRTGADHATVNITHEGGWLVVTITVTGSDLNSPMVALADRVGALGGHLTSGPEAYRAEIPCG